MDAAATVSILVRSMDRATLPRALASAAAQDWPAVEIVVVAACGHRHRALPELSPTRPTRLVSPPRDGVLSRPQAANLALNAAVGEWLLFLDDDDELLPTHVSALMAAKRQRGERVVYGSTRVIDDTGGLTARIGTPGSHVQFLRGNRMPLGGLLLHRNLLQEGARFDEAFDVFEDYDFLVNLATRTAFAYARTDTYAWHAHAGDSGGGMGDNFDAGVYRDYGARVRKKWAEPMKRWRDEFVSALTFGSEALKRGDAETAREVLERALAGDPQDPNALNLCAMANFRCGRTQRALAMITAACEAAPDQPQLAANRALIEAAAARA